MFSYNASDHNTNKLYICFHRSKLFMRTLICCIKKSREGVPFRFSLKKRISSTSTPTKKILHMLCETTFHQNSKIRNCQKQNTAKNNTLTHVKPHKHLKISSNFILKPRYLKIATKCKYSQR